MLTADDEYSCSNTENLSLPTQLELPEKLKMFSQIFITFLESTLILEHFEQKNDLHGLSISEVADFESRACLNE